MQSSVASRDYVGHFRKVPGLQKRTAQHSLRGKLLWAGIPFLALSRLAVEFGASSLSLWLPHLLNGGI